MSRPPRPPRFEWLPPLLVGASAAVATEVAVAVLLYGGPGFVRSLTTILAVSGIAFAGGLWSAPPDDRDIADRLRSRWLVCLSAFLVAGAFGTAWSLVPWLGEARAGQGLGLALLAGVPLYGAGTVLGTMSVAATSDPGRRLNGPGAAAAAGAAFGFVLTGVLLPRAPMPASLLIAALIMLSLGGMVYGSVLGSRTDIDVRARRPGRSGPVRVQVRRLPSEDVAAIELWEGPHLRRVRPERVDAEVPWDVALARALTPPAEVDWRVLLVGGGASGVARTVVREHPTASVHVVERTGAIVELGREYFDTELVIGSGERCSVEVDNLDDVIARLRPGYDLIVVDTAALAPLGGVTGLSRASRAALFALTEPDGIVAWGPLGLEPGLASIPETWSRIEVRRVGAPADEGTILTGRPRALERMIPLRGFEATDPLHESTPVPVDVAGNGEGRLR